MNFSLTMKPIHRKVDRRFASQELLNTTEKKTTICMKFFFLLKYVSFLLYTINLLTYLYENNFFLHFIIRNFFGIFKKHLSL